MYITVLGAYKIESQSPPTEAQPESTGITWRHVVYPILFVLAYVLAAAAMGGDPVR